MHEYVGNIHLHSTFSDGTLSIEEIARIGARSGLDFLIITDHQTLAGLEQEQEGYYDKTLVLIGMEVNQHQHHYLGLNMNTYQTLARGTSWVGCDYYLDSRGFRFAAHSPRGRWGIGSTLSYHDNLDLHVQTPGSAWVRLVRNGKLWTTSQGRKHRLHVNRPGVYRVEALHRRGWR